jgi:hypothetical protein
MKPASQVLMEFRWRVRDLRLDLLVGDYDGDYEASGPDFIQAIAFLDLAQASLHKAEVAERRAEVERLAPEGG